MPSRNDAAAAAPRAARVTGRRAAGAARLVETMAKKMLIDATHPEETRVVVVDGTRVEEFDYETITKVQISGNIYLAKVTRVEPSLQAAFVEYGGSRHGFLAFAEIHPDYYQIPVADREALLAEERAMAQEDDGEDDEVAAKRGPKRRDGDGDNGARRRRDRKGGGRKRRLATTPDALEEAAVPEALLNDVAAADAAMAVETPPRTILAALGAAETDGAPSADAPDLSDVDEIEIHHPPSPEDAAAGATAAVERIDLRALRGAPAAGSAAESAGIAGAVETVSVAAPAAAAGDEGPEETPPNDMSTEEHAAPAASVEAPGPDAGDEEAADAAGETAADEQDLAEADAAAETEARDESREIETLGSEDARDELRPRRSKLRDYKIQEVVKRRQIMLVQVVKEERGTKGAALTTYLSLAGRYCVLMPNTARGGGISRKITNAADRKRLKSVALELEVPEGMGLIVRTAGANRTKAEIKRDFEYLLRQWSAIRDLTLRSVAPTLIYEEGSLIKRAIRDLYNKDIDSVLVEGEEAYREAKDYMKMLMPSHARNVQPHRELTPLFMRFQVESQIGAMMNPTVPLKSGGYLVINVTEALVAVDVNSGRSTKEGSIEDTALKTNLEAAEEVVRQMRLRDLAGLIVIDFIDMEESRNNRAVEKRLKDKLKTDRARIQVGRISGFGLLEMSRQRLRPGLLEATTQCCPHCKGSGVIRSSESMALTILRAVEEEGVRRRSAAVRVAAPIVVANYLINQKRARIAMIEERYDLQLIIDGDPSLISPDFVTERVKPIAREEVVSRAVQVEAGYADLDDDAAFDADEDEVEAAAEVVNGDRVRPEAEGGGRRRARRRGRRSDENGEVAGGGAGSARSNAGVEDHADGGSGAEDEDVQDASPQSDDLDGDSSPKKRRGRRGGRRRRKGGDGDGSSEDDTFETSGRDADADVDAEMSASNGASAPLATTEVQSDGVGAAQDSGAAPLPAITAPQPDVPSDLDAFDQDALTDDRAEAEAEEAAAQPAAAAAPVAPAGPRRTGWWSFRRSSGV